MTRIRALYVLGAVPLAVLGLAVAGLAAPAGAATSARFAPPNRPGPALTVSTAALHAALHCEGPFRASRLEPVLLSPATGVTPEQNYSWNYERAFTAQHRPWCAVTMPHHTLGDITVAGEYLVYAIRAEHAMSGRRIAVLGHSQGGMSMRWALRFWPDTRALVDDVIGLAGSNHGTTAVAALCVPGRTKCPPADWQQGAGSNFIRALNSYAETFAGVSYTEVFTHTDEVVQPNSTDADSSSALHTGRGRITNVSTQDICPPDVYEHLTVGTIDPVAHALVADALDHAGPADPARVSRSVCRRLVQPGVDPLTVSAYVQLLEGAPGLAGVATPDANLVGAPEVAAEPPLPCYVYVSGCPSAS
jgi:hypothetical protein